ncbi:MAG: thioredoxin family protein [Planctomycetes bacterium]|nr:thioredoxin family protein [Planctomycetota bacterium]
MKQGCAVIDFTAAHCGPCRLQAPIVDKLAAEFAGRVKVGECDGDEQVQIAIDHGVTGFPTLIFFRNGEMVDKHMGLLREDALRERIAALGC